MTFTSDLTVDELVLIEEAGFEPLELVLGSSYYNIGWQTGSSWSQSQELDSMTNVLCDARFDAMRALLDQANRFNADGVVGVRLEIEHEGHEAEFTAIGTAVRRKNGDGRAWRDAKGRPFTSDLSGADFWALIRAGFRPVSLAYGVCVYHIAHQSLGGWLKNLSKSLQNMEQVQFTQALYDAREIALGRVQREAEKLGADAGVVAMSVSETNYGWGSHVFEFAAVGTAVSRLHESLVPKDDRPIGTVLVAQDLFDDDGELSSDLND